MAPIAEPAGSKSTPITSRGPDGHGLIPSLFQMFQRSIESESGGTRTLDLRIKSPLIFCNDLNFYDGLIVQLSGSLLSSCLQTSGSDLAIRSFALNADRLSPGLSRCEECGT